MKQPLFSPARFALIPLLLLVLLAAAVAAPIPELPKRSDAIRIAILKGTETVRVEADGCLAMDDAGMPVPVSFPAILRSERNGVSVAGRTFRRLTLSPSSTCAVNGKSYRGLIELSAGEKGLLVVNELPVEDYLVGLINCEISSQWPMEAIKAQAVIARSYALYQKESRRNAPYHLESSVMDQVYDGTAGEDSRATRGVHETAGEVIQYGDKIIQAFFHSSCGGHTEAAEQVWGNAVPYLQGVPCAYCSDAPSQKWEQTLTLKKIESLLKGAGHSISGLKEVTCGPRNPSGRVVTLFFVSAKGLLELPAVQFRKIAGYGTIRSTSFEVRQKGDDVVFTGGGYGHGVGLCQWGAKSRAADGFTYREIIRYYYPGTTIRRIVGTSNAS